MAECSDVLILLKGAIGKSWLGLSSLFSQIKLKAKFKAKKLGIFSNKKNWALINVTLMLSIILELIKRTSYKL